VVLAAIYILWWYQRTMTGPVKESNAHFTDLNGRERWGIAPVLALIVALGFFPQVLLNDINPAVERTVATVGVAQPEPTVATTAGEAQ